ncbi:hypothetical protein [Thiomicrorhabdus xiamenensis]|uniref:Hook-length control protein FliK n=1 Tax=Thiomicrorhabdus xiamenensis TaxID=2739063 RepID=A0A7D4SZ17_9GAMM|nr:hypothetical protein [Thiomicrorhabdus xiamenensis]QKI89524.1 hypothetical protein HQN79_08080 [Thiomicrorhabdus xiamenensis]
MLTITHNLNSSQLAPDLQKSLLASLKTGQILNASIEKINGQEVTLRVGQNVFTANTTVSGLQTGEIQLSVKQTQPSLVLAIAQRPQLTASSQEVIQAAIRQHLVNQQPLGQISQQLTQLLNQLPSQLQPPLTALLEQLRKPLSANTGNDLKNQLNNSGLFLESKLLLGKSDGNTPKQDLKAQFLQFKQLAQQSSGVQNAATQLASKLSDQAISKITLNQLQLYQNPAVIGFEFAPPNPQTIDDQLEFRKKRTDKGNRWEVFVNLQTSDGELKSKISFDAEENLYCGIWCQNDTLGKRIESKITELHDLFEALDLQSVHLRLLPSPPEQSKQGQRVALIDIHI